MYLEKLKWLKYLGIKTKSTGANGHSAFPIKSVMVAVSLFAVVLLMTTNWSGSKTYFDPYKGVSGIVYAAPPGKPLDFFMQKGFETLYKGKYFPLANELSIVNEGEEVGSNLDAIRFALYNIGCRYFNYPAADWTYPARLLAAGKTKKEALAVENLGMAFQTVPYFNGKNERGTPSHMCEPYFFTNNGGMIGWERKFADGKTRRIVPNDAWACLRPNTYGLWRDSGIDVKIGVPSLDPEESLPVAFYVFTKLCDWQTGEWDIETTRWLISRQYAFAFGIYIDPEQVEISGKGLQTRFLYHGELPVAMAVVRWKNGNSKPVPLVNNKCELCFFGSKALDQSIFIPFSYLCKMEKDDEILLAGGTIVTSFQDILEESAQVRKNISASSIVHAETRGGSVMIGYDVSQYVVKSQRLQEIADRVIRETATREEAVERIMEFVNVASPYVSDHKGDKNDPKYNGPVEIPMSPLVAFMNRGDDCEGHATSAASLFVSASLEDNSVFALCKLTYQLNGEGHIVPMFPNIGTLERDPFPNYVVFNNIPFSYLEATGHGDDRNLLHQVSPSRRGYLPEYAKVVSLGKKRKVETVGFNQFRYELN